MKIRGTNSIFSIDSLKTVAQLNKTHTTGNKIRAVPGLLKARITQRSKIINAIIANIHHPIITQSSA
jgi:hypothetical protein